MTRWEMRADIIGRDSVTRTEDGDGDIIDGEYLHVLTLDGEKPWRSFHSVGCEGTRSGSVQRARLGSTSGSVQ